MHSYVDISSQGNDSQSRVHRHREASYKEQDWGDRWISRGGVNRIDFISELENGKGRIRWGGRVDKVEGGTVDSTEGWYRNLVKCNHPEICESNYDDRPN